MIDFFIFLNKISCDFLCVQYTQRVITSRGAEPWRNKFYVPEHSIMHLTVSARFLISSGREENRRRTMEEVDITALGR